MKKLLVLLVFLLFAGGCSDSQGSNGEGNKEQLAINIFSDHENIILDFMPEEKTSIKEIIDEEFSNAAVILETGEVVLLSEDFFIDKDMTLISSDKEGLENVVGIYLTDNYQSITNAYYNIKDYLDDESQVMVVLLDGFSYNQYKITKEKEIIPFLSEHFKYPALSVYTPVTNAGFAAIITGQGPNVNGVHDRSVRDMRVETIFDYGLKNNKKSLLLEGSIKILNTEIEPQLHIDTNKNNETDNEIYQSALKAAKENHDLIFIHFHGIDDRGHTYGPYSEETMGYIQTIDRYLQNLSQVWEGVIIIVPDHGMRENLDGGGHGICVQSDMIVPYFIKEP